MPFSLITGPPGSGKTAALLEPFREAVRAGRSNFRLLVPTATMQRHLRNELARQGLVFRPEFVTTLSQFVRSAVPDLHLPPSSIFHLIVEDAVRRAAPPQFARVSEMAGFHSLLVRTIQQFDRAGVNARSLAQLRVNAPLAGAFATVWGAVETAMRQRGYVTRAQLIQAASARIAAEGPGYGTVWIDGFGALAGHEVDLVAAISKHADGAITLPEEESSQRTRIALQALGFEEIALSGRRKAAAFHFRPESIEREAEEIARLILSRKRPFRETGIVLRNPDNYAPVLRATLERFHIPARFYFTEALDQHPVARYLTGIVDAAIGGWDHEQVLALLRLVPHIGTSVAADRFDFKVRKQVPNQGLDALAALTSSKTITHWLSLLRRLELGKALQPSDWALQICALSALFSPGRPGDGDRDRAVLYHGQAVALKAFADALNEASGWWPASSKPLALPEFWTVAKAVLRLTSLRENDQRRDVVHVISTAEARQWDLPTVFICGMTDGQFPRHHPQNPFFPDAALRFLQNRGIPVETASDRETGEAHLFQSAAARATETLYLSYPRLDDRGDQTTASAFLTSFPALPHDCLPVLPETPAAPSPRPSAAFISSPVLLNHLLERHPHFGVTNLETFLQCPFQFFATRTLRLETLPPRPEERLDFLLQGNIVHAVLSKWYATRPDMAELFQQVFTESTTKQKVPQSYRTELLRRQMLADLRRFEQHDRWPRDQFVQVQTEEPLSFDLAPGFTVKGRMDRVEYLPDGSAVVVDYKYSGAANTRKKTNDETKLQGPLYILGARHMLGVPVSAMVYYSLRKEATPHGWGIVPGFTADLHAVTPEWLDSAARETLRAMNEIRAGRVGPAPARLDQCSLCDVKDVCRYEGTGQPLTRTAGGE